MPSRERPLDVGAARGRDLVARLSAELRKARLDAGLGQADVARTLGVSSAQLSRIERGLSPDLSITMAARLGAVLGLAVTVRAFPTGDPIRDAAQAALLERLHSRCHRSFIWRTEVPLPIPGDLRAWDATVVNAAVRIGIEAETRLRDVQAVDRRIALKARDGEMDRVVLLLLDTRGNRDALRVVRPALVARFPIDGRQALASLEAGLDPGGNAIVVL